MRRFVAGLLTLALGLSLTIGDAFLEVWEFGAQGQHDIVARGPFLLGMFVPYLSGIVVLLCVAVALWVPRGIRARWPTRAALSAGSTIAILLLLYIDPLITVWRVLAPVRGAMSLRVTLVVDVLLVLIALWLVRGAEEEPRQITAPAV